MDGADSESEGGDANPGPGMADEAEEGVASLSLGPSPAEESPQLPEEPAEDMDSLVGRVFLQVTSSGDRLIRSREKMEIFGQALFIMILFASNKFSYGCNVAW